MSESPLDAERFDVIAWDDPVVRRVGFAHDHPYVETHWLPVLGPTATWLLRRLATELAGRPGGLGVDASLLAASLGVARSGGGRGAFGRALQRCIMFGVVRMERAGEVPLLAVRTHVPPLSRRQLERLAPLLASLGGDTAAGEVGTRGS
jgi:hypothetical protein